MTGCVLSLVSGMKHSVFNVLEEWPLSKMKKMQSILHCCTAYIAVERLKSDASQRDDVNWKLDISRGKKYLKRKTEKKKSSYLSARS